MCRVGNLTQWISLVTDRERPKYSERSLSNCYFPLHHKSSMNFSGQVDVYSPELLQHTLSGLFKQFCSFPWVVMMVCFECIKALKTNRDASWRNLRSYWNVLKRKESKMCCLLTSQLTL